MYDVVIVTGGVCSNLLVVVLEPDLVIRVELVICLLQILAQVNGAAFLLLGVSLVVHGARGGLDYGLLKPEVLLLLHHVLT